jgi:hypothetical protein
MPADVTRSDVGGEAHEPILPAGKAGTLSTRTSDTAGVVTVAANSVDPIAENDIVAVSWVDVNLVTHCMYGMKVTGVASLDITVDYSGSEYEGEFPASTVFPAEDYAVVISKKVTSNVSFDKDDVTYFAANANVKAVGSFGGASEIYALQIPIANSPVVWDGASGTDSPFTSDPTTLACYNCTTTAGVFQYGVLLST